MERNFHHLNRSFQVLVELCRERSSLLLLWLNSAL